MSSDCTWLTSTVAALLLIAGCAAENDGSRASKSPATDPARANEEWFTERAEETGLDFVHFNGASGHFYYPEILPPGVGLLDYDNDGDLDVYLVQGRMLGANQSLDKALIPPLGARPLKGRLYRNDLRLPADGTRELLFTEVTDQSGINANQYGLGVAAADVDNDGWVDLFLTNFGTNQLFHNNGDGTFTTSS